MKKSLNEVLQNDDLIYNRMSDMDQEQLVSMILSFAESNPSTTLVDYLNNEFGYNDDIEEGKKSNKQKLIDAGYSESDAEDFVDEFEQGGVKVPQKVKDILSDKSSMNESMFPMWKKLNKIK